VEYSSGVNFSFHASLWLRAAICPPWPAAVVYDSKLPALPSSIAQPVVPASGNRAEMRYGRTYSRIFGATTSPLEHFLLKRGLMGPCWLRLMNVTSSATSE